MKRVLLLMLAVLAPVAYAQGPTITNLAVTATGATTATIAWTTSVPATSQLLYGPTTPPQQLTPAVATLVTSHVLTVHGLTSGSNYYYQAISTDSGGKTTSGTQEFQLCAPGGSAQVGLSGTTNNYYEYGEYTIQWQNLSGQSVSPTVCGVPLTTPITGQLDYQSTFAVNIPSTLAIVPSPSGWQITETGIDNSIGAVTASFTTPGTATNITNQLAAAASGQLIHVWFDPATSTFYPALSSSSVVSFAAPAASWPTWLVPTVTNPTTTPSLTVSFDATSFPGCQAGYACTATYFNSTVPATGYELGGSSVGYAITMDASHYFHITNESVPQDVIATHGGGADDLILNGLPGLHGLPGFVDVGYGYNNSGGLQVYGGGTTLEASIATPGGIFKGGIGGYTLSASQNFGVFNYGTTPYSDTGIVGSYWGTVNNYIYDITGNSNSGTAARGCRMVGNDLTTAANNYGQLCINSSGYSGSGDTNQAGWVTLNSHGQDLAVGADGGYTLHLYASNADVATATGVNWYFTQLANTSLLATGAGGVLTAGNANNASAPANCIAASGSATAYTCATSPSAVIASYTQINFVPDVTSGTNPTLAVNGAAAAPIYQQQGTVEVTATDLLAGIPVTLTWNSGLGYWLTAGQNANTSAGKINGGSMPASQWILGSNALNQPIAELSSATPTGQKTVYMSGYTGGTGVTVAPTLGFTGGSCTTNPAISGVLGGTSMTYYQTGLGVCTLVPSVTFTGGSYTTSPTVTLAFAETVPVINNNTTAFNFDNMTGGGKLVAQNNPVISLPTLYNPTISSPLGTSNNTTLTFTANGSCLFSKYNSAASLQSNCYLAVNRGNYTTATMGYVTTVSGYLVSGGDVDIATAQTISYQPTYHGTYMQLPSGLVMNLGEAGSAVTLAATATGSGYTGSPVCTVTGGTLHTGSQDTCTITLSGGGLAVTGYVNNGTYTKAPAIAVSGVSGGSGFFQYLGFAAATTPSESVWADPSGVLAAGGGSFNLATAWAVIAPNGLTANGLGNRTSLTVAAGAALGTGSPVAACAANTTCGWNGGVVNIYADTAPTTGVVFTLTDTVTHANYPGCVYEIFPASSSYVKTGPQLALTTELYDTNQSYTVQTYNVSSALTTTTYYVADYACF